MFSGEVNPVYTRTLKYSHTFFAPLQLLIGRVCRKIPNLSTWLDKRHSTGSPPQSTTPAELMRWLAARHVRVFQANRNSWSSNNPHNRLVNVFLRYVEKLCPPVFDGECSRNRLDCEGRISGCPAERG